MADETLRFDIVGEDRVSAAFTAAGASAGELSRHMDAAARQSAVLDEALRRQAAASRVSVDASLALARADKILEDAEHGLTAGALEAEFALKREADAKRKSRDAALEAAAANKKLADSSGGILGGILGKLGGGGGGDIGGGIGGGGGLLTNPYVLGGIAAAVTALLPELTAVLAGFTAATAGAGAFALLAVPSVKKVETAYTSLNTAQQAYAAAQAKYVEAPTKANATALANAKLQLDLTRDSLARMPKTAQDAVTGIQGLVAQFGKLSTAFAPQAFKIFADVLQIANNLLPTVTPLAAAFARALDPLLKTIAGVTAAPSQNTLGAALRKHLGADEMAPLKPQLTAFQQFIQQIQTLIAPAVTAIGTGIGHLLTNFGKLLTIFSAKDVVNAINIAFSVLDGTLIGLIATVEFLKSAWDKLTAFWTTQLVPGAKLAAHDVAATWDDFRHRTAVIFDGARHDIAHTWDQIYQNTIGTVIRFGHNVETQFNSLRNSIATTFDQIRHDIAAAWDLVWNNTVGRVQRGITDTVLWFRGLPGKITAALGAAATLLTGWGAGVIKGLLAGMTSAVTAVWDFIKSIPGKILSFLGIKSPPQWAIDAGRHIMNGIGIGINQAQNSLAKATAAASSALANAAGAVGPVSGDAAAAQNYARSRLAAYGWGAAQMPPLILLWDRESGWSRFAYNAGSGATGIPQSLPYTKMPRAAWLPSQGGQASMSAQVNWGLGYIKAVYGSPAAAWAHEQAHNWYGSGLDAVFRQPTVIGVGERGPEHVTVTPGTGGQEPLLAELRGLRAELRHLTGVAAAIPARTGQHVAAGVNSAGADAAFRRRYPS